MCLDPSEYNKYMYIKHTTLSQAAVALFAQAKIACIDTQGSTTSKISRAYDVMGRLTEEKSRLLLNNGGMTERTLRHTYDHAGNRVRSVLPGGELAEFTPCAAHTSGPSPTGGYARP